MRWNELLFVFSGLYATLTTLTLLEKMIVDSLNAISIALPSFDFLIHLNAVQV